MTRDELCRKSTESHLRRELENVVNGYMYAYDEYYKTFSRDSAFLKDATDAIIGIASVLEVYSREELKIANRNFEYAKDDLVDYYTYQIKANQAKLDYLIKIAKTKGIEVDMINDIKFRHWQDEEAG